MIKKFTANEWQSIMPNGWEDGSMITLVGAVGTTGFAPNIVVTRDAVESSTSVQEFAETQKKILQQEINGVIILDERTATINGADAVQFLQRIPIEGQTIQQVQTFVQGDNRIYCITGTAAVEDFNNSVNAFKFFTDNFKINEFAK